jgi:hypothetical protein
MKRKKKHSYDFYQKQKEQTKSNVISTSSPIVTNLPMLFLK